MPGAPGGQAASGRGTQGANGADVHLTQSDAATKIWPSHAGHDRLASAASGTDFQIQKSFNGR